MTTIEPSDTTTLPAIVLAGGLGTRLRSVISDMPKPMAPVNGKPFLHYIFVYLKSQGIKEVVLSVGYKHELIMAEFGTEYMGMTVRYAIEAEPLGTGGGIKQAMDMVKRDAYVLNGDTFFDVSLSQLYAECNDTRIAMGLCLKRMKEMDRYGTVEVNAEGLVSGFKEKQYMAEGLINGGVYLLKRDLFDRIEEITGSRLPEKFSFEKELLEGQYKHLPYRAIECEGYFIDIGIPEDYARAQVDMGH